MRISLTTLWTLYDTDPDIIEIIHDFHFMQMEEEMRYCLLCDTSGQIKIVPLRDLIMDKKVVDTKLVVENTGAKNKKMQQIIDLVVVNLRALKGWLKFASK